MLRIIQLSSFNRQVWEPGQAVSITKKQTGGHLVVPDKVHAVIGDEKCLPTGPDSRIQLPLSRDVW